MHKEELLELHEHMVTIRDYFAAHAEVDAAIFEEYDGLGVDPEHVHKSKSEHKHAVLVLGNALADAMSTDEFSNAGRVGKRMRELAEDAQQKL